MPDQVQSEFQAAGPQCRQFDLDLAAFLEGEKRTSIASHAKECPACNRVLADLDVIRTVARETLFEDPSPRVWTNVRATLAAEGFFREPASGRLGRLGFRSWLPQFGFMQYAAPLAALGCMAMLGAFLLLTPGSVNQNQVSTLSSNQSIASGAPADLLENTALEQTVSQMEKSFGERAKDFDPAVQASYQKGLRSLDNSIRESRVSVQNEPSNTLARDYLTNAYEQKAAVLSAALEYNGR